MKNSAIIFAAGKGTRLRPMTYDIPKPLIELYQGKSMIDLNVSRLIEYDFLNIFITVSYHKKKFEQTISKYKKLANITILDEKESAAGHIAPLRDNLDKLQDTKILLGLNGDTFIDTDLAKFIERSTEAAFNVGGSEQIQTLPQQLLCVKDEIIGVDTIPQIYYKDTTNINRKRNNLGIYSIPTRFVKLMKDTKGYLGMFEKNNFVDQLAKLGHRALWTNLKISKFVSYNTPEELEMVRKNLRNIYDFRS